MERWLNKILLGDCLDVMREMPDKCVDLVLTDPPYGIKRFEKSFGTTRFKGCDRVAEHGVEWDKKISKEYFDEMFRIGKNHIIWGANNYELPPSEYFLVWDKKQTVDNFASAEYAWTNCKIPAKVFRYSIHQHNCTEKNRLHPTQKPVALFEWILKLYSKPGDIILDPFLGSGTTVAACINLERQYIGIEISPDYVFAAEQRIKKATAQRRMFL